MKNLTKLATVLLCGAMIGCATNGTMNREKQLKKFREGKELI